MKTKAVRIYGENDLRLEEFELPEMQEDEILLKVVSDSICMSTYKAAIQGAEHKRVPNDVAQNPTIVGHEFCGEIVKVGSKWAADFKEGQRVSIQPALNDPEDIYAAPGYSFKYRRRCNICYSSKQGYGAWLSAQLHRRRLFLRFPFRAHGMHCRRFPYLLA